MDIRTSDGISILILPDNARCAYCGENPTEMDECPIKNFDDYGEYCVPEFCEYYTEDDNEFTD